MKGTIFTEFLEMVEGVLGPAAVDELITAADLPTDGVYTGIGTYDPQELVTLVGTLAQTQREDPHREEFDR